MVRRWMVLVPVVALTVFVQIFSPTNSLAGADLPDYMVSPELRESNTHLSERQERILIRLEYKEQLIVGMLEQRYTLRQVAREFLLTNEEDSITATMVMSLYPGDSDEQKAANNVIDFVAARNMSTCDRDLAVANLMDEYERLYNSRPVVQRFQRDN
ncbi:MAG: hypothetical protein ACRC8S_20385 [Fimbriiglobus sp.]